VGASVAEWWRRGLRVLILPLAIVVIVVIVVVTVITPTTLIATTLIATTLIATTLVVVTNPIILLPKQPQSLCVNFRLSRSQSLLHHCPLALGHGRLR
jgi:hypothetical protein